jgi:hypothetical protein
MRICKKGAKGWKASKMEGMNLVSVRENIHSLAFSLLIVAVLFIYDLLYNFFQKK